MAKAIDRSECVERGGRFYRGHVAANGNSLDCGRTMFHTVGALRPRGLSPGGAWEAWVTGAASEIRRQSSACLPPGRNASHEAEWGAFRREPIRKPARS